MHTFRDSAGRTWPIEVHVTSVRRVRDMVGVDLLSMGTGDHSLYAKLANDPVLLCNVLYVLCRDEANRLGVSDEEFGKGLAGQAIDDATSALLEELTGFFQFRGTGPRSPGPRMRTALEATNQVMASLEKLRHLMESVSGSSSTSVPALPASIPAP
jgi:hypothetical protein